MVSFWFSILSMCIPIYPLCRTCKYVRFISPTHAKCRYFINLNKLHILEHPNDPSAFYKDVEYIDVDAAREDNGLCGENATYYERRIK